MGGVSKVVCELSNATFSIYLMHVMVLQHIQVESIGGYSRLCISIIVFTVSFVVYKVLSFIPYSKYILG